MRKLTQDSKADCFSLQKCKIRNSMVDQRVPLKRVHLKPKASIRLVDAIVYMSVKPGTGQKCLKFLASRVYKVLANGNKTK